MAFLVLLIDQINFCLQIFDSILLSIREFQNLSEIFSAKSTPGHKKQGCQIFLGPQVIPNGHKLYRMAVKIPTFSLQNIPKLGFFGLKINHLATLTKSWRNAFFRNT
jgi:hypothetical protein